MKYDYCKDESVCKYIIRNYSIIMSDNKDAISTNNENMVDFFAKLTESENMEDLKKYGIGFVTVIIACAVFYVASTDPKALTDQFYIYCFFGVLPVIIGIIIASKLFSDPIDSTRFYFYSGIMFVFAISMYMFYQVLHPGSVIYVYYALSFLSLLVFLVGLAIIYRIFVRTVINTRGWMGFFLKFLFLVPCLLIDLLETFFSELKSAPKMVIVLFILEILIVLAYLYIPRISKFSSNESVVLLNKPVFLSKLQSIGHANQLFMSVNDVDNPSKDEKTIRQNYSISMWFYVNQHANTYAAYSKETNIFRYGYPNSSVGHPRVAYFNDVNDANKSDKFIVYINDAAKGQTKETTKENPMKVLLQMPTQSWNQLVISYNKTVVDIFVNGNLEKSVPISNDARPEYNVGDIIEVGEGDNTVTKGGLHGAICNVVYHKHPLTPFQVAGDYNLNRYKNPPVNS